MSAVATGVNGPPHPTGSQQGITPALSGLNSRQRQELMLQMASSSEDPEDGFEGLIRRMDSPLWNNVLLIEDVRIRSQGLSADRQLAWWHMLFEHCFTHDQSGYNRLELVQNLLDLSLCEPLSASRACALGSCVHMASECGSIEALQFALLLDPQGVFIKKSTYGLTPLHCAAIREDESIITVAKLLIDAGIEVNALSDEGETALFRAVDSVCCQAFLDLGMDPNIISRQGATALATFLYLGACDSALLLLKAGAHYGTPQLAHTSSTRSGSTPAGPRWPLSFYTMGLSKGAYNPDLLELCELGLDPRLMDADGYCAFDHLDPKIKSQLEADWISASLSQAHAQKTASTYSETDSDTKRL